MLNSLGFSVYILIMNSRSLLTLGLLSAALALPFSPARAGGYGVAQVFKTGGDGSWDYLTVDSQHHLLFVPRSTHTQVLDESSGRVIADIPGQKRNHGVAVVPSAGRGFISDGADASVVIFDLKTYKVLGKVKAADDADGIIYDEGSGKVLLSCGDSAVLIPISPDVDPNGGSADPAIDLGGKPEFLGADGRGRAYVNLEDKDQVAVVDIKAGKVVAKYSVAPGGSPVGMAVDPVNNRLFIGCRKPQKMIVMDATNGKVLADLPIGAGVDATKFGNGDAFASCRDGTLTVVRETAPGAFSVSQTVQTKVGARTMGLDADSQTIYLPTADFVPGGKGRPAPKPGTFQIVVVKKS